jgi:DNA-binding transcriptional LysR family regulator
MELRQLTYFLAAAQTQNFRRAAELCLVAQPALSRQIAALEAELGVQLFKRVKQRVALTPAGQEFASYARNALDLLQQGQQAMLRFQEGQSGTVQIGCNRSLATIFLPTILAAFQHDYPHIRHRVRVDPTDAIIAMVERDEVDLGLIFDPVAHSEMVIVEELFRQALHLVVSAHHPLAHAEPHTLTLERIIAEPLFLLGEASRLRKVLERIFTQRGLAVQPAVEIDSVEGLKEMVKQGNGVTLIPPALVRSPQIDSGLVLAPVADLTEEFIFALVYKRFGSIAGPARQVIKAIMAAHANRVL